MASGRQHSISRLVRRLDEPYRRMWNAEDARTAEEQGAGSDAVLLWMKKVDRAVLYRDRSSGRYPLASRVFIGFIGLVLLALMVVLAVFRPYCLVLLLPGLMIGGPGLIAVVFRLRR